MLRFLYKGWLGSLASIAIVLGRKRRALALYEQIAAEFPRDERALATVGNLRMETGDAPGAIHAFETQLGVNPRSAEGWFNLGFIHDRRESNAEAERCFR